MYNGNVGEFQHKSKAIFDWCLCIYVMVDQRMHRKLYPKLKVENIQYVSYSTVQNILLLLTAILGLCL